MPTFDYKNFETWGEELIKDSADFLTPVTVRKMQQDPESIGSGSEIMGWLDRRIFEMVGTQHASEKMASRLKSMFSHIRIYHGTRIESLNNFMQHGLIPGSVHRMEQLARETLGGGRFSEITDKALEQVFTELRPSLEQQKNQVYFCLDDRNFEDAGQYLTYGAEYLCWVVANLQKIDDPNNDKYHRYLRSRGIPTVLIIDYPIADLPPRYESFWAEAVKNLLWKTAEETEQWHPLDYTITLPLVHPSHIFGHYHPEQTHDPFHGFAFRKNPFMTCDHCPKT